MPFIIACVACVLLFRQFSQVQSKILRYQKFDLHLHFLHSSK